MYLKSLWLFTVALAASAWAQTPWKLPGSTTVAGVLESHQTDLEEIAAHKITFEVTSSTHGLEALALGKADFAMISSSIEEIAAGVNKKHAGAVNVTDYRANSIGATRIRFIVNPRNPVRKISAADLADVLTGKISNWSKIGGPDAPILFVSLASAGSLVREKVTKGEEFRKDGRLVNSADQISTIVAQDVTAIGIISDAHKRGLTSFVDTDVEISASLFLVTKGEPTEDQAKLIAAAKTVAAATR